MLKCPACGRSGGPFRLRHQIQADSQVLRSWSCPCGNVFNATGGAERVAGAQPPYSGFVAEWNGRSQPVQLQQISKHESVWAVGSWTVRVSGPPSGPGTRFVALLGAGEDPVAEWKLELSDDGSLLTYEFDAKADRTGVPSLLAAMRDAGIAFKDLDTPQSSLEDIFVGLIHHQKAAA